MSIFFFFFTIFQLDNERKSLVCGSKSLVASKQTQEVRESESNSVSIVINYVYMEIIFLKNVSITSINVMPYLGDNAISLHFNQMWLGRIL